MLKIPKIVRSRLARKTADTSAAHPDPNLLAAFAEDSLLARERASVTAHLAECADCRESLALAFAAQEPELFRAALQTPGSAFGARLSSAWFRRWRWVASAAVACAVLAVALQYRSSTRGVVRSRYQEIAALQKSPAPEGSGQSSTPDSSTPRALPTTSPLMTSLPPATRHNRRAMKLEPQSIKAMEERLPAENAAAVQSDDASRAEASLPKVPQPAVEASALRAPPAIAQENAATVDATTSFVPSRAVATPSRNGLMDAEKLKAEARQPVVARRAMAKMSVTPGVLWTINASPETAGNPYGVVQRSADRGKTWESVALNDRVNFRAVAASGDDVWAGGSGGVLFHSPDGGAHWVEITVAGENSSLTGAIVSIDAHDQAQIRITTSSRERWISTDHSRHWTLE